MPGLSDRMLRVAVFTDEFGTGSLTAGSNTESLLCPREYQSSQQLASSSPLVDSGREEQ